MSIGKKIAFGAAASWLSRGVTILLGLVLMPVLFRHLPKEELGVWLLLGQSWAAMGILDLGFGVTLTRRIALAKGKSGGDPNAPLTDETRREIADLVFCGRRIYRIMAAGVFLVSWALGFFYLRGLDLHGLSHATVWTAWTILCACQALGVWGTVWTCLLQGVGYIGWDAILGSFVNAATLSVQIIAVLCGGGLVALAAIAAGGAILQRGLVRWFARRRQPDLFALRGTWNRAVLKGMPALALRAWLTATGITLVLNTDQLFIAKMEGASELPAYRAAYLVLLNVNMLAVTVASASAVFISHLWQAGNIPGVQRIVIRNLRIGLGIMACGGACILGLGPKLFDVWLGPGNFIGYAILSVFFLLLFLEAQCFVITTSSRATEDEAFAKWAMGAGLLKLVLSFILGWRYGLLGIALSTLLAQLATNHWFMVLRGLHRLQIGLRRHNREVLLPVGIVFVVTLISVSAIRFALVQATAAVVVFSAAAVSAIVLGVTLWNLVLEQHQRVRLLNRLGFATA